MKKIIAILLCLMLVVSGCSLKTREEQTAGTNGDSNAKHDPVEISLIAQNIVEKEANLVRDQLEKAGFSVKVNLYPDFGTFQTAEKTGTHDICIRNFSGAGSPDANTKPMFHSEGVFNREGYNDPELDELIDLAASQVPEVAFETYKNLEQMLVVDKAYTVPLFSGARTVAINKNVVDEDSIDFGGPMPRWLFTTDYIDKSLRETRPYIMGINWSNPNSFDSLRGSDGSTWYARSNINVRLVLPDASGEIVTKNTLTKKYEIAEGNTEFYFLLRDDINFGKVVNGEAVDSGMLVAAEDAKYTYDRAIDPNAVPGNSGGSYLSAVKEVSIVTDIEELKNTKVSGSDKTIFESLNEGIDKPFTTLAKDRNDVDNSAGKYQVLKIESHEPYPQLLLSLGATQLGIVPKEIVEKVNEGITVDNYDPSKDVLYGDPSTLEKGKDHNMYFSGQYVLLYVDDYGTYIQRNPGFAPGTDEVAKIKDVVLKPITDNATQTAALRNGEIDEGSPAGQNIELCEADENVTVLKFPSVSYTGINFYMFGESKMKDENLRKAVLYAINQDEIISVMGADMNFKVGSPLVMLDTGFYPKQDLVKSAEYLNAYYESLGK